MSHTYVIETAGTSIAMSSMAVLFFDAWMHGSDTSMRRPSRKKNIRPKWLISRACPSCGHYGAKEFRDLGVWGRGREPMEMPPTTHSDKVHIGSWKSDINPMEHHGFCCSSRRSLSRRNRSSFLSCSRFCLSAFARLALGEAPYWTMNP